MYDPIYFIDCKQYKIMKVISFNTLNHKQTGSVRLSMSGSTYFKNGGSRYVCVVGGGKSLKERDLRLLFICFDCIFVPKVQKFAPNKKNIE